MSQEGGGRGCGTEDEQVFVLCACGLLSLPPSLSFILWLFPLALCHSYILWLSHQAEPLTNMPIATTEKKLMMLKTTKRLFSDRK